jgi:hypothetical protein
MTSTEVTFIHPDTLCDAPAAPQRVEFQNLNEDGLQVILSADKGFWGSPQRPYCPNCGVGLIVEPVVEAEV